MRKRKKKLVRVFGTSIAYGSHHVLEVASYPTEAPVEMHPLLGAL